MKILALETSTDQCSVALLMGDRIVESTVLEPRAHARLLLAMIDDVLAAQKITVRDLDLLAYGNGPGSFTGLRIACSVMQGLSVGIHRAIVPISSLRALAQGLYRTAGIEQVFSYLAAGYGQKIYGASYAIDRQTCMQLMGVEAVMTTEALRSAIWEPKTGLPSAQDLLPLAVQAYHAAQTSSADALRPTYLSPLFQ